MKSIQKRNKWFPKLQFVLKDTNKAKISGVTITLAWIDVDEVTRNGTVTKTTNNKGQAVLKLPKFKTSGSKAVNNVEVSVVEIDGGNGYEYDAELNEKDSDQCPVFSNNCPVKVISLD
mmetsp:Transcript_13709/g.16806  ORF Transcript_13709/g.16806 Transcript_13709/m.16806 type:complete len:118 (+) Transcript_13709:489-842(+)